MLKNKVLFKFAIAALQLLIFSNSFCQAPKKLHTIIVDAGHGGTDAGAVGQYENSLRSKEKDVTLAISKKLVAELKKQFPDLSIIPTRTTDIYQHPTEKARIANENGGQLFICIHADSGPLKQGKRQISTRVETRYKITYTGKGRRKKKISTPYTMVVPVYEYFKIPLTRSGTSVWIFAPHKTSEKLNAIMKGEGEFVIEADATDSALNNFDFKSPEGRMLASLYTKKFLYNSDMLATLVNKEVAKTGRNDLGVSQRQEGIWVLQATNMPAILVETGFINNPEDERYLNSAEGQQELAELITTAVKKYKEQLEKATEGSGIKTVTAPATNATKENTDFTKRNNTVLQKIEVKQPTVTIDLYDNADVDGDMVSVFYNGKNILDNKTLTDKPIKLTVTLDPTKKENEFLIYAENEGSIPPNTGLMIVNDGTNRYEVHFKADSKQNGVIIFTRK
jgi:N-acetylmuramoyl-L-alanine amidase